MSDARTEVERKLRRIRGCIESIRFRIDQRKKIIKRLSEGSFDGATVEDKAKRLKSDERIELRYLYVERILQGILDQSKEPPAVEGDSQP